ncbi:hypothetical protein K0040_04185 [Terrisporobacter petrolearius]|uniref:Uncharacterized protein n=1 Tax=Terrisporobacter hibernicus TaxID=2813371 RepID=A0AAX2ZGV9_9FIRM|nr:MULTISPECIES: hypothetical protein [Terrisporobacter]MCC3863511.1 hypothetical protein [Terrisporobacter petrolearius]UEL47675.1 hypothetical protein JW646_18970 [Terrisporobacter hibernicus]
MSKNQSIKVTISFKENYRDLTLYNYLLEDIKNQYGISSYVKNLIERDMEIRKTKTGS